MFYVMFQLEERTIKQADFEIKDMRKYENR